MEKILLIISDLPYPKHISGTATTLYNLIEHWRASHKVDILFYGEKSEQAYDYYRKIGINVRHINITSNQNIIFEKSPVSIKLKPRNCFKYDFSKLGAISVDSYSIVILAGFSSGYFINYLSDIQNAKVIFFELDCLSLLYARYYKNSRSIFKKIYYYTQHLLIRLLEKNIYKQVNKVIFVSEVDKYYCKSHFKKVTLYKFDNIVNGVEYYQGESVQDNINKHTINVGFSGILDYTPNLDATNFIVVNIIGKAIEVNKNIVFHIIGKNPSSKLIRYKEKFGSNLRVTGFVEDINKYIACMDIYISPLFIGTGMKNKILQAMNLGVPIICTSISAEGINELEHQKNCIICDSHSSDDWIDYIAYLSDNKEKRKLFSKKTKEIIAKNYLWENIANDFIKKCILS